MFHRVHLYLIKKLWTLLKYSEVCLIKQHNTLHHHVLQAAVSFSLQYLYKPTMVEFDLKYIIKTVPTGSNSIQYKDNKN